MLLGSSTARQLHRYAISRVVFRSRPAACPTSPSCLPWFKVRGAPSFSDPMADLGLLQASPVASSGICLFALVLHRVVKRFPNPGVCPRIAWCFRRFDATSAYRFLIQLPDVRICGNMLNTQFYGTLDSVTNGCSLQFPDFRSGWDYPSRERYSRREPSSSTFICISGPEMFRTTYGHAEGLLCLEYLAPAHCLAR